MGSADPSGFSRVKSLESLQAPNDYFKALMATLAT